MNKAIAVVKKIEAAIALPPVVSDSSNVEKGTVIAANLLLVSVESETFPNYVEI